MSIRYLVNVIIPLLIGGLIYIIYRTETLIMFSWFSYLSLDQYVDYLRTFSSYLLPDWVILSLPNGLWTYSFIVGISFIWNNKLNIHFIFWFILALLMIIFSELGQLVGLISGTFDKTDLLIILIAIFLATIQIITNYEKDPSI